eukprot:364833-Chlamydomonas_euryale.AAC.23
MSDEIVFNLVTYVHNKRPILAVLNSSQPHFLVSLRYVRRVLCIASHSTAWRCMTWHDVAGRGMARRGCLFATILCGTTYDMVWRHHVGQMSWLIVAESVVHTARLPMRPHSFHAPTARHAARPHRAFPHPHSIR